MIRGMKKTIFTLFFCVLSCLMANAKETPFHLDNLTRIGNDVIANFTYSISGYSTTVYFGQSHEHEGGNIVVVGSDGTQFATSGFYRGSESYSSGLGFAVMEEMPLKMQLKIYNVPKNMKELSAIRVIFNRSYDGDSFVDRVFWNLREDKDALQIH